jgi:phosphoribosylformimino-5-aminoimidazole carboxamide ribotide isomerase
MVGVDCRSGQLAVEGWEKQLELPVVDFCETLRDEGIERVVLTDIERDGMLSGPNLELTQQVLTTGIGVIASGGVGRLEHLQQLRSLAREAPGFEGVIVGQALYRGRFTLEEALDVLHDQQGGD